MHAGAGASAPRWYLHDVRMHAAPGTGVTAGSSISSMNAGGGGGVDDGATAVLADGVDVGAAAAAGAGAPYVSTPDLDTDDGAEAAGAGAGGLGAAFGLSSLAR